MSTTPDRTPTRLSALQDCLYTLDELPAEDRTWVIKSLNVVRLHCPEVLDVGVDWKSKARSRKSKIIELEARVAELESDLSDWEDDVPADMDGDET